MTDIVVMKNGRTRARRTHCKHGHEFPADARWATNWKGYSCRVCNECQKIRMQRKRANPDFKANEAAKMRRWREANPERNKVTYRSAYQRRNRWLQDRKKKCKFCPENRFPCLDFHHRERGEKVATIGQVRHWNQERLVEEIAKCDVVCANCHRWLHWKETAESKEGRR